MRCFVPGCANQLLFDVNATTASNCVSQWLTPFTILKILMMNFEGHPVKAVGPTALRENLKPNNWGAEPMSDFFPTEIWNLRTAKHRHYKPLFQHISYKNIGLMSATSDLVLILVASIAAGIAYHLFVLQIDADIEAFAVVGLILV